MIRRPPRSTRTDTLFPYTTLFRSLGEAAIVAAALRDLRGEFAGRRKDEHAATARRGPLGVVQQIVERRQRKGRGLAGAGLRDAAQVAALEQDGNRLLLDRRSEERRVGKESVRTCRSRWSPDH